METFLQTLRMTLIRAHTLALTREINITLPFSKKGTLMRKKNKARMMKITILTKVFLTVEFNCILNTTSTFRWMLQTLLKEMNLLLFYPRSEEVTQFLNRHQDKRLEAYFNLRSIKTKILLRK